MNALKSLIKAYKSNCVLSMETNGLSSKLGWVCSRLWYPNMNLVEAKCVANGMVLLWKDELELVVKWKSGETGGQRINIGNLFGCYGTLYPSENVFFFSLWKIVLKVVSPRGYL